MAIPAAAVIIPVGVVFFISGLVVNLIQAFFFVLVRPFSKNVYRKINRVVAELLWLDLIWLIDWWAGVKIQLYTDPKTFKLMGKEHALVICNHKSDIDWLVGWILAQRSGCLGSALAVMKKSSKFLPAFEVKSTIFAMNAFIELGRSCESFPVMHIIRCLFFPFRVSVKSLKETSMGGLLLTSISVAIEITPDKLKFSFCSCKPFFFSIGPYAYFCIFSFFTHL